MFNQCADFDFTFSFLKMNRKVEFASDELFDLTSGSSGEEYIPHSSEDSSEGTDTSEVIQPVNQKESMLRFPILGKYADIGELNDVSSKQILNRGRSPSRRGGNSGMRHKRQCPSSSRRASYPTTHASSGHSTKRSGEGDPESVLQKTTPDLEKDLPDSASSLHTEDVADGSLSISAVYKKENGSRMYNKKQYCNTLTLIPKVLIIRTVNYLKYLLSIVHSRLFAD